MWRLWYLQGWERHEAFGHGTAFKHWAYGIRMRIGDTKIERTRKSRVLEEEDYETHFRKIISH